MEKLQLIILFLITFQAGIAFGVEAFKLKEKLQTTPEFLAGLFATIVVYGGLFSLILFYKSIF